MQCKQCGYENQEGAIFCENCGNNQLDQINQANVIQTEFEQSQHTQKLNQVTSFQQSQSQEPYQPLMNLAVTNKMTNGNLLSDFLLLSKHLGFKLVRYFFWCTVIGGSLSFLVFLIINLHYGVPFAIYFPLFLILLSIWSCFELLARVLCDITNDIAELRKQSESKIQNINKD